MKLPDQIDENLDEPRGGGCPQLAFAVEMGDIEAPNAHMVEAKHEAKWPLQGLATEHECGPNQPPREAPYERGPDWPPETLYVVMCTGTGNPRGFLPRV